MRKNFLFESSFLSPRVLVAFTLCLVGLFLGVLGFAATPPNKKAAPGASGTGAASLLERPLGSTAAPFNRVLTKAPFFPSAPAMPSSRAAVGGAAGTWSMVPSPNASAGQTTNFLYGVACSSSADCWAVGYSFAGSVPQTLIERWDGASWTIFDSPNSSPTSENVLNGVTCVSGSDCWAVGYYFTGTAYATLIQHWDGMSWAIVASPNTSTTSLNYLTSVTCAAASDCWAVGGAYNGNIRQTLIVRWDGVTWATVTSPNTSTSQDNLLNDVTCASSSECWAVGYSVVGRTALQTLTERWNGTSWTIVASPNVSPTYNRLLGVTCVADGNCWAVGYYVAGNVNQTLIQQWDGAAWRLVLSPNTLPTQSNVVTSVTCTSTADCWAIGSYYTGSTYQTLIEHWNGTSWAIVPSPNTGGQQNNYLYGLTCVSGSDCWTVGISASGNAYRALTQHWDGTSWSLVGSSNPISATQTSNLLGSVTCLSESDCWAAGYYYSGSAFQTLIHRWDGVSWMIVNSPNTSTEEDNSLSAITCVSNSDCWAVGKYKRGGVDQSQIQRWDGLFWKIVESPDTSASLANSLNGVACISTSDCWAVGYAATAIASQTLIQHWDGTSWAIVASPNMFPLDVQNSFLTDVTCISGSDCWAVGGFDTSSVRHTLVERWDGSSWTIVTSPNTAANQTNLLSRVACTSGAACWAVGYYHNGSKPQTLIERWDGSSWAIVASPNTSGTQSNYLTGLSCASTAECWAVGYAFIGSLKQTLIQRWDGSAWTVFTSPNTSSTESNLLFGVTCLSGSSGCWAVGNFTGDSFIPQTLTIRYVASAPLAPARVVSRKSHAEAGDFDIDLPLNDPPGIECRSGGANGDYMMVFTFVNTLSSVTGASATSGTGTVSSSAIDSSDARKYIVNLTGVANAQTITVRLTNVSDSAGNSSASVSASMGVLLGDTSGDGVVNSGDITQVRRQSGQVTAEANKRIDLSVDGVINSGDITLVRRQSGTALSTP